MSAWQRQNQRASYSYLYLFRARWLVGMFPSPLSHIRTSRQSHCLTEPGEQRGNLLRRLAARLVFLSRLPCQEASAKCNPLPKPHRRERNTELSGDRLGRFIGNGSDG